MGELIEIKRKDPRRTWVKGHLQVKCRAKAVDSGTEDPFMKDFHLQRVLDSNFILTSTLSELQENQEAYEVDFNSSNPNWTLHSPSGFQVSFNNEEKQFRVKFQEIRFITTPRISRVIEEEHLSFATYDGEAVGYVLDFVEVTDYVLPEETSFGDGIEISETAHITRFNLRIGSHRNQSAKVWVHDQSYHTPIDLSIAPGSIYVRLDSTEYVDDAGKWEFSHWSDGSKDPVRNLDLQSDTVLYPLYSRRRIAKPVNSTDGSWLSWLFIIGFCIVLFRIIGAWILFPIGLILILLFAPIIERVLRFVGNILLPIFFFGYLVMVFGLVVYSVFANLNTVDWSRSRLEDNREIRPPKPTVTENDTESVQSTGIYSRYRVWQDYDGTKYETELKVRVSDVSKIRSVRENAGLAQDIVGFNSLYFNLLSSEGDQAFNLIYKNLDTIRQNRSLNRLKFAEMIVSMVQDIPYVLLLPADCDWRMYNDEFIKNYLVAGEECMPDVRNGLLAPTEFVQTLSGDCDTRTLFTFKILHHYGFDVRILNSEKHGHSIIALHEPGIPGNYFLIDGKKYYTWETTAPGLRPGLPLENQTNERFWQTALY